MNQYIDHMSQFHIVMWLPGILGPSTQCLKRRLLYIYEQIIMRTPYNDIFLSYGGIFSYELLIPSNSVVHVPQEHGERAQFKQCNDSAVGCPRVNVRMGFPQSVSVPTRFS